MSDQSLPEQEVARIVRSNLLHRPGTLELLAVVHNLNWAAIVFVSENPLIRLTGVVLVAGVSFFVGCSYAMAAAHGILTDYRDLVAGGESA